MIWVSKKGKEHILRNILYVMVAFVLAFLALKVLGTEKVGGI